MIEPAAPDPSPGPPALSPAVSTSIVGIFVILLAAAVYSVRDFVLPIVLASLVTLAFAPAVRNLRRHGVPPALSAVLLFAGVGLFVVAASTLLSDPIANMIQAAPDVVRQIRHWFSDLSRPFAALNQASREIEAAADGVQGTNPPQTVVVAQPGMIVWVAGTLAGVGTTLAAALVLLPFFLASGDSLKAKLVQLLPSLSSKKQSLRILRDTENEVSRYLLTTTAINATLGLLVGVVMLLTGMPNPILWAFGATLLNFIPWVGAWTGIALALAVAAITFPTPLQILLPPAGYILLSLTEGTVVSPLVLGRRLELSVVAILITLSLTTWVWGVIGAIIGVPLLVVVKVFCDRFPTLAPVAVLLSAEPTLHDETEADSAPLTALENPAPVELGEVVHAPPR